MENNGVHALQHWAGPGLGSRERFTVDGSDMVHYRTQVGPFLRSAIDCRYSHLAAYHVAVSRILLSWLTTTPI